MKISNKAIRPVEKKIVILKVKIIIIQRIYLFQLFKVKIIIQKNQKNYQIKYSNMEKSTNIKYIRKQIYLIIKQAVVQVEVLLEK